MQWPNVCNLESEITRSTLVRLIYLPNATNANKMDLCIDGHILYLPGILFSALRDAPTILIEFVVSTCICNICIFVFVRRILNWQCNISEPLVPRNIRFSVVLLLAIKPTISATTCQQSLLTRVKGGDDIKMHKSCHPCNYKHFCLNKNT